MQKRTFPPGTMLYPTPVAMVTCGEIGKEINVLTIAWTGIVNSEPPMTYISVRKSRFSHEIISKNMEFVINLTTEQLTKQADYCGVKSGRQEDKFKTQNLTPVPATQVKCPMILESPINLECKVTEIHTYPSHDMFVAEIVAFHADESLIDETGKIRLEQAELVCFNHGSYYAVNPKSLGRFGYSVMKPKTKKRIAEESKKK